LCWTIYFAIYIPTLPQDIMLQITVYGVRRLDVHQEQNAKDVKGKSHCHIYSTTSVHLWGRCNIEKCVSGKNTQVSWLTLKAGTSKNTKQKHLHFNQLA